MPIHIKLLIFLLTGTISIYCNAQPKNLPPIAIVPAFAPHKTYRFEVEKINADTRKPGLEKLSSVADIDLKVTHGDSLQICVWKYKKATSRGLRADQLTAETRYLDSVQEAQVVYIALDAKGNFQEFINFNECRQQVAATLEYLFLNEAKPEEMRSLMNPTLESPALLLTTYYPDASIFFALFGDTLEKDSIYYADRTIPNPLGGEDVPFIEIKRIKTIKDDKATIVIENKVKPDDFIASLQKTVIKLGKDPADFDKSKMPALEMQASTTYIFDFSKKIITHIVVKKVFDTGSYRTTNTLKITLKN